MRISDWSSDVCSSDLRQARCILIDPYANAFDKDPTAPSKLEWSQSDQTEMKPGVAERKWEIDSLCYPMRLSHEYWRRTRDKAPFDDTWSRAMTLAVETFRVQQRKHGPGRPDTRRGGTRSVSQCSTGWQPIHKKK